MEEKKELYQLENGEWVLYPYLLTCTDKGTQEKKYTDDVAFYETFANENANFTIDEVVAVDYNVEQLARLNEVQGLKYKDFDEIHDYVINGNLKSDSKVFAIKVAEQNRADIDYLSIMAGVEL